MDLVLVVVDSPEHAQISEGTMGTKDITQNQEMLLDEWQEELS